MIKQKYIFRLLIKCLQVLHKLLCSQRYSFLLFLIKLVLKSNRLKDDNIFCFIRINRIDSLRSTCWLLQNCLTFQLIWLFFSWILSLFFNEFFMISKPHEMLSHFNNWFFSFLCVMHIGKEGVKTVKGKSNK